MTDRLLRWSCGINRPESPPTTRHVYAVDAPAARRPAQTSSGTSEVIGWQAADDIVERLDPDTVPACALCLFELARAMHECRPSREIATLLQTTCDWVWLEIDSEVEARLARLRMRRVPHAEAAARDVRLNRWKSRVVRVLVARLARRMADEMGRRDPPTRSLVVLPPGA